MVTDFAISFLSRMTDTGEDVEHKWITQKAKNKAEYHYIKNECRYYLYEFNSKTAEDFIISVSHCVIEELCHWALSDEVNRELADNHSVRWAETFEDILQYIYNMDVEITTGRDYITDENVPERDIKYGVKIEIGEATEDKTRTVNITRFTPEGSKQQPPIRLEPEDTLSFTYTADYEMEETEEK